MKVLLVFLFICNLALGQKNYQKNYFDNGSLASEGWIESGKKVRYWKFYHDNGNLKSEGHYNNNLAHKFWKYYRYNGTKQSEGHVINGKKTKWWVFYDELENVNHKCQLKDGVKDGYCLRYKNNKLVKAEKYANGKKINEWTDYRSFRKENKLSDLK